MKTLFNTITLIALCFFVFVSCKKNEPKHDGYTITGNVSGVDSEWVKIVKPNYADRGSLGTVIDSAQIQNGTFKMKGKVEHVDMMSIFIGEKYRTMGGFLLENSAITLTMDLSMADKHGQFKPTVLGSKMQDSYEAQEAKDMAVFNDDKYASLLALRKEMEEAYESKDEAVIKAYREKAEGLRDLMNTRQKEYQQSKIDYVLKNPSSPVAPYILSFQFSEGRMSKDKMKAIYPVFKGEAKHTAMFKYYEKTYDDIFNSLGEGSIAPDFKLNDVNGNEVKLSEVKAKYKLVDFWASWCVPCRASFPHLKELYKKYEKDGFEIVGVGTADEEEKWRKAIEEDQTPWMHLNDTGANHQWGVVARQYSVPFLPTTFLMDENEKIILRNPTKEDLDNKLTELFNY
ncbi:redoxin domain-containing protein [Algibacter sp. Ld11]|uniref:redoxin domain-containing protein n=1 Tax=Algibacter sp. Ld11 TaxID=649150 RepID=UPI00386AD396